MTYRIGIDVGGTFTDVLLINDETGKMLPIKTPSTTDDQSKGVLEGIRKACALANIKEQEIYQLLHGTTVATNAVLEEEGAIVGLIVTKGFRNILHLARGYTPGPLFGWMNYEKPRPLASMKYTYELNERIDSDGSIIQSLDEKEVENLLAELVNQGVQAITISLLNSYANPVHEQRIKKIAERLYPEIPVSVCSDILLEFKEYERTLTTVMNSYVKPKMKLYLGNLEKGLEQINVKSKVNIVRSDNGLMRIETAADKPVHTMLSGPSGGVTAASFIGGQIGYPNLITFDMGGTSTDVSIIRDNQITLSRTSQVGYFPVKSPSIDIASIGAGGGSIAHVPDITGVLRVGPQSSGASPGPACYGKGGEEPTVTDANAVLGRLPDGLLDGAMKLDLEAAKKAVSKVAEKLNLDLYQAAQGILDIVNENMFGAIRVVSVERGLDPRDYGLIAFGGAGPLNANAVAMLSGSFPVIIPPEPGVLSSLGFNVSDYKNEFSRPFIKKFNDVNPDEIIEKSESLEKEASKWLEDERINNDKRKIEFFVDVRYYLQGFEIPIEISVNELKRNGFSSIIGKFHNIHERLYNFKMDVDLEVVNIRAIGIGETIKPSLKRHEKKETDSRKAIMDVKQVYFDNKFMETNFYNRNLLKPGNVIEGPAIITQYDTTTVVLPNNIAEIDEYLNIIINKI